jgi:hypothetical protein
VRQVGFGKREGEDVADEADKLRSRDGDGHELVSLTRAASG